MHMLHGQFCESLLISSLSYSSTAPIDRVEHLHGVSLRPMDLTLSLTVGLVVEPYLPKVSLCVPV